MDDTLLRITRLMKEQKIQDQQMIEYLCLPRGTFSNWRREIGRSYYQYIDKIADRLGVSIDYLVRGQEMKNDSLDARETELIMNYRKMSERGQRVIFENAELLAEG